MENRTRTRLQQYERASTYRRLANASCSLEVQHIDRFEKHGPDEGTNHLFNHYIATSRNDCPISIRHRSHASCGFLSNPIGTPVCDIVGDIQNPIVAVD